MTRTGLGMLAAVVVCWVGAVWGQSSGPPVAKVEAKGDPMDAPLALLAKAKAAHAKVADYTCMLIKRETLDGELTPNHVIALSVREAPFSVHMRWLEPKKLEGQEACYVAGRNDGKVRVRGSGLLGAVGFVSLSLDDARLRKASRHSIDRAGLGYMIERCEKAWLAEKGLGKTKVQIEAYDYAKRRCTRVEMTHTDNGGGKFEAWRNVVYFDDATQLPIRVESYAWPRRAGQPAELMQVYSYVNMRTNVGLGDEAFRK